MDTRNIDLWNQRFQDYVIDRKELDYPCLKDSNTQEFKKYDSDCKNVELFFEEKMEKFSVNDRFSVFCALMRIIKQHGYLNSSSIFSAWYTLDDMIKKNSPDLNKYLNEPNPEISIKTIRERLRFCCSFSFRVHLFDNLYGTDFHRIVYFPVYNRSCILL